MKHLFFLKPVILLLFMLQATLSMAQNKTTIQVFTYTSAWSMDKYSYTESITNNRADFSNRHYPTLGIVAVRNKNHGYFGLGITYSYMQSTFSYLIDSLLRWKGGEPYSSFSNLSNTNTVEKEKIGLHFQYFYRLNDHFGLKGWLDYSMIYKREFGKSSTSEIMGFGRSWAGGDSAIMQTQVDMLNVEKKPLQRFSVYLGGVYQPHPFLELSIGIDCQPVGSLIAERNVHFNDVLISQLKVYDRHLKINFGIAYTFLRKQRVHNQHQL